VRDCGIICFAESRVHVYPLAERIKKRSASSDRNRISERRQGLEGIADGEVEGLVAAEAVDVEVAGTAGVVGQVEADAPVETDDEEVEVVAEPDAGTQCELAEEVLQPEVAGREGLLHIRVVVMVAGRRPDVAGIEEDGSLEVAEELGTVLEVGDELDRAVAEYVVEGMLAETLHGSRTHATYGEGADAVGTAHIEHLAVGYPIAVAIGPYIACIDVSHEPRRAVQPPRLGEVGLNLQEL